MYPQGACRIRKPACAGNGCAIFPTFGTARIEKKIRCSAEGDLFRVSLGLGIFPVERVCVPSSVSRLRGTREPPSPEGKALNIVRPTKTAPGESLGREAVHLTADYSRVAKCLMVRHI